MQTHIWWCALFGSLHFLCHCKCKHTLPAATIFTARRMDELPDGSNRMSCRMGATGGEFGSRKENNITHFGVVFTSVVICLC